MYCPVCGSEVKEGNICANCNYNFLAQSDNSETVEKNTISQVYQTADDKNGADSSVKGNNGDEKPTKNKKSKRKIIIPIVIVSGLLLLSLMIVSVIGIGYLIYVNSDGYKTEQAEIYILEGDYEAGIEEISNVHTTEADTLRGFVDLLIAKDDYIENVKLDSEFGEYYISTYDDLQDAVEYFESEYDPTYLCDELETEYKKISECVVFVDELYNEALMELFIDAQMVQLNMVDKNRSKEGGPYFTISSFQDRISVSEDALAEIEADHKAGVDWLAMDWYIVFKESELPENSCREYFEDSTYECYIPLSSRVESMCYSVMGGAKGEINACKSEVDDLLDLFEDDAELYMTNPDRNYTSDMGDYLIAIDDYNDMEENAENLVVCLKIDVLFYLFVGETTEGNNW